MKEKEKPKYSVWQNVCFMVRTAWRRRKSVLFLCLALAALSVGTSLAQLFVAPQILSKVEQAAPLAELLGTIAAFSLGLFLLNALYGYADENSIYGRIDIRTAIMNALNRKACVTSYPNTRDPDVIKLQEKAKSTCSGNQEPTEYIWHTLTGLLINVAGFAIYLALLSNLNWLLIGLVLVTTAAGFFVTRYLDEWEYRHREEEKQCNAQINYIRGRAESIELAKDIRIFGLRPWLDGLYQSARRLYQAFFERREKMQLLANVADVVLSFARNGIAYVYLIRMALDGGLTASEFLLYFSAVSGFTAWVTGILSGFTELHKESLGLSQVQEYLNYPEPFRFEGGDPIPAAETYELKLEDVSFRYPGTDKELFRHLNLTIHPGEKLAVVGLNGAGKTTLVKLLCGFYDPDKGRVLLNGTDIRTFDREAYYTLFSAVFQKFSELDITVAQTVAQKVEDIDLERVADCLEKAGLTEAVAKLPKGLDTHIGRKVYLDGVLLSGGQTQRLMLARALYKNGPILVLDEPTAALDPIAENDIYQKYSEMTAGKTSLFISHRLASTRFCDRIIYLADGAIAEEGTHEQLLALGGGYAKLFDIQSRYYQEGRTLDEAIG